NLPLAWLQLRHKPLRLLVALAGIGFAVLLIMMQLGFRAALFESAVRFHERLNYDIALFSTNSVFIVRPEPFSHRRLYQALGDKSVTSVSAVHIFPGVWKNPWNNNRRSINVIGFDPSDKLLDAPGFETHRELLRQQDVVIFDSASRPEYGPVAAEFDPQAGLRTELNNRNIKVVGLFEMGTSFGIDGSIMTSEDNWLRLFPNRTRADIELGLIHLQDGADAEATRDRLRRYLPKDILVMTKADFVKREKSYWNAATPIGYIFAFGAIMGFVVGAIIVYQILFADVSEHLNEYATLRALGYPNRFISGIVIQQAIILGVLGYFPGIALVYWLSAKASAATHLPLYITQERALTVFLLTLSMCAISALLAVRKVARLDPADVF
ncbi:MAG: FtsX-like permease family protein, partial [Xanthomonadales bacterium]|nr:FtsX-like permease family protein [Xanthomonadales bacterium]